MQPQWRSTLCRPRPVMCDPSPGALHIPGSERLGTNPTGQWRWRAWLAWQTRMWRKTEVGTGEPGTVRTALCRGLSLRPQSFFLIGIGRKLKVIIAKSSSRSLKTTSKSVTFLFWYKAFHFPFLWETKGKSTLRSSQVFYCCGSLYVCQPLYEPGQTSPVCRLVRELKYALR